MVALAIFSVMMAIIFVPLNLGLKLFHIGQTRANALQAAQATIDAMERELRRAVFVYPNEAMPGVTDRAPYINPGINPQGRPYVAVSGTGIGVCDTDTANASYVDNPSRLDFLLPDHWNGTEPQIQPVTPLRPGPYLVTYYYRRMNAANTAMPGEPFDNPITLFRAQMPYRLNNGSAVNAVIPSTALNVNLASNRYPNPASTSPQCDTPANSTHTNRGSYWLNQLRGTNESNLEELSVNANSGEIPGSHAVMLPRGVALTTPAAFPDPAATPPPPLADYTPTTTFRCADTNNDGKIDQVTITLALSSYDDIGGDRRGNNLNDQRVRLTQTVSLPNVR
jgi:hypothetical protein